MVSLKDLFQTVLYFCPKLFSLIYLYADVHTIEYQLNKDFTNLCEWLVGNKLSIHLDEEKTKCILFSLKQKLKNSEKLKCVMQYPISELALPLCFRANIYRRCCKFNFRVYHGSGELQNKTCKQQVYFSCCLTFLATIISIN